MCIPNGQNCKWNRGATLQSYTWFHCHCAVRDLLLVSIVPYLTHGKRVFFWISTFPVLIKKAISNHLRATLMKKQQDLFWHLGFDVLREDLSSISQHLGCSSALQHLGSADQTTDLGNCQLVLSNF